MMPHSPAANDYAAASRNELSETMDSHFPEAHGRARITMACATCRQRKSKCDGVQPICGACKLKGRCCKYEPVSKLDSFKARIRKKHDRQRKNWEKMVNSMAACGIQPPLGMTRVEPRRIKYPEDEGLIGLGITINPPSIINDYFGLPTAILSPSASAGANLLPPSPWSDAASSPYPPSPMTGNAPMLSPVPAFSSAMLPLSTPPLTPSIGVRSSSPSSESGSTSLAEVECFLPPTPQDMVPSMPMPPTSCSPPTPTFLYYPAPVPHLAMSPIPTSHQPCGPASPYDGQEQAWRNDMVPNQGSFPVFLSESTFSSV